MFVVLRLKSLSMIPSRSIHVITNDKLSFFLWLSNTPLHIYHFFLIHSSVTGHLDCFHILAIVNNAAVSIQEHISFWMVRVDILVLFLILKEKFLSIEGDISGGFVVYGLYYIEYVPSKSTLFWVFIWTMLNFDTFSACIEMII